MDSNGSAFSVPLCPDQPTAPSHMEQRDAPPCGPDHENMQLQTRSRAQSAIYSQATRRSGRDTSNDARTSCSKRELCPRQWREQQQHAHCAQQTRPVLLFRTAAHVFTLTVPRWVVRSALRVVVVNLLQPCRLAADRAADGLLERCGLLVTVDLQHDAQYVTARLPDVEEVAPQRSAWRARQHEALDASLNHHPPALESPRGFFAFLPWAFLHSALLSRPCFVGNAAS